VRSAELKDQARSPVLPPVLCYHRIGGPAELGVTRVAKSAFTRQMTTLARAGWKTLTLDQFAERLRPGYSAFRTPHSAFLLTFDDGYASLAEHAYPVLADVGFTATTFLITDYVGRLNTWDVRYTWHRLAHLDWDAIGRWRERGFDFASHTATHPRLTWLSDGRAAAELERSRETLRHRLGPEAVRAVAYPFGARDARIERLAGTAGYELGFGGVRGEGSPLALARLPVYRWDVGRVPLGLRPDAVGAVGRLVADVANRCAVGTSVMQGIRSWVSGVRGRLTQHLTPDT
jgi:peptidoglycan/xylan/chitin deacetylase (PgdA/CDA1 family)